MRVVIVGGYGQVGSWIAKHLVSAGHDLDLVIAAGGPRPEPVWPLNSVRALCNSMRLTQCLRWQRWAISSW
jgi:nucleoside-diphosphate-sugar epimerase